VEGDLQNIVQTSAGDQYQGQPEAEAIIKAPVYGRECRNIELEYAKKIRQLDKRQRPFILLQIHDGGDPLQKTHFARSSFWQIRERPDILLELK
jgi:hypothetical protein